jgi:hypothetical protein
MIGYKEKEIPKVVKGEEILNLECVFTISVKKIKFSSDET